MPLPDLAVVAASPSLPDQCSLACGVAIVVHGRPNKSGHPGGRNAGCPPTSPCTNEPWPALVNAPTTGDPNISVKWAGQSFLRFVAGALGSGAVREHLNSQWGAPLMFTYLADVLIYLGFGITMAACLWYVDGSLKDDAD